MAGGAGVSFHSFIRDGKGWETLATDVKYANPFAQFLTVKVRTPSRPAGVDWTVIHRKAAAVVAPITADGHFVLVRQERVPIRATIWEFPAGQIDQSTGIDAQTIRATALRELREESGYELAPGGELLPLGMFFPSAGFTDEHSHLFVARPVVPAKQGSAHDAAEAITECRAFPPDEFRAMIASGEIRDANTLATYARMCAMGIL
jgi:ADP-ribose pyrophosphatase